MATAAYLAAAKNENMHPTVLMRVEDAGAKETLYTTEAQWNGSDTLTEIRTSPTVQDVLGEAGDAWHKQNSLDAVVHNDDNGRWFSLKVTPTYDHFNSGFFVGRVYWPKGLEPFLSANPNMQFYLQDTDALDLEGYTIRYTFPIVNLSSPLFETGGGQQFWYLDSLVLPLSSESTVEIASAAGPLYLVGITIQKPTESTFTFPIFQIDDITTTVPLSYSYAVKETAQLITSEIDLGGVPDFAPILTIDDTTEFGSDIVYSYSYSSDNITYTPGGTTSDGAALPIAQYFKLQADFTTTNGGRGKIKEYIITEGLFLDFGTHLNTPINGVKVSLTPKPVSSLVQRIDLRKGISTTAELSVKMFWLDETSDLISTGYLKGKDVSILTGFVGLDLIDYESVFVGTWYDHNLDETSRMITVKVRNIMKQFEKQKLPFETFGASGTKTTTAIPYDVDNIIAVILDLYDRVGIRDRYIGSEYAALQAGPLSGPGWNVSRDVVKPTEVWKMLDELAQTAGLWLIPLGNGQILPKLWDRNEAANLSLAIGGGVGDFGQVAGNLKEFYSRYYSYFNPSTGVTDPSRSDDYDSGTALINATAELKWFPEKGTKEFVDKWMVGRSVAATPLTSAPKALTELNKRWDSWFTEPLYTTKVKKLPPYFAEIEPADVIPVNGLLLPVPGDAWDIAETYLKGDKITFGGLVWQARQDTTGEEPEQGSRYWQYTHILDTGYTDEKRFLVLAKTTNVNEAIIELDIMEMPSLTRGEVTMGGYASIRIDDGAVDQTGITTTPVLVTGWEVNGDSKGLIPDFANNKITIDIDGAYAVGFQFSYGGSALDTTQFHLRIDSVEEGAGAHRKLGSGGDTGSLSFPDVLDLVAGDVATIWVESDVAGGATVSPLDAQFVMFQVD